MTDTAAQTWLTQEAYDRLNAELEELSGPGRQEIADRIEAAREEGDLKENGGYHAAKEEQGKQEARIRQLTQLLATAVVGTAPVDASTVVSGTVITVEIAGREQTFLLGSREVAGGTDLAVFSENSPMGNALLGHTVGDTVTYEAPNGKTLSATIKALKPFLD